jgi:hypothetical protein
MPGRRSSIRPRTVKRVAVLPAIGPAHSKQPHFSRVLFDPKV